MSTEQRRCRIAVVFHSTFGHNFKLASALAEGAKSTGADVDLFRIPDPTLAEMLKQMGADKALETFKHVPEVKVADLANYDGLIVGGATRFGGPSAPLKAFIDSMGQHWMQGTLVGKVASVFGATNTQHGGNETTLLTLMVPLFHLGFAVCGLPYTFAGQKTMDEITGGSPYGITTIGGGHNDPRDPSKNELDGAKFQGKHTAELAAKFAGLTQKAAKKVEVAQEATTQKKGCACY
jgi:NAD(P)H dehydrogenase (quinone)